MAFLVALSMYFLKYLPISNWIILPMQLIIGAAVLIVICERIKMKEYQETKELLLPHLSKIIKKKNFQIDGKNKGLTCCS